MHTHTVVYHVLITSPMSSLPRERTSVRTADPGPVQCFRFLSSVLLSSVSYHLILIFFLSSFVHSLLFACIISLLLSADIMIIVQSYWSHFLRLNPAKFNR